MQIALLQSSYYEIDCGDRPPRFYGANLAGSGPHSARADPGAWHDFY